MQVTDRVALKYKDGPEVLLPESLVVVDEQGQKWMKFRQSHYMVAKLVLGHLPEYKAKTLPSLSNNSQFISLQALQRESLGLGKDKEKSADEIFSEDEKPGSTEKSKKTKMSSLPKQCTVHLKGVDVVLKTPQSWKEKDFLVQLQPQQLEAVVEYILEAAESCFGKKRKYEASGAFAKKAKNA